MQTQATAAEGATDQRAIDGAELLRAAELMDQQNPYDDPDVQDTSSAQQKPSKEEPSEDRASDASGSKDKQDKAEPSAEQKQEPDTGEVLRDEKGRFKAKEQDAPEPAQTQEESKYSKAKKEEERQRNLLSNFEKDKQEFRAEQERIRQELEQQRAEIAKFRQIPRQTDGTPYEFNSKQYGKAADDLYAQARKLMQDGDIEQAQQKLQQAEQCSITAENVWKAEQQYAQDQQQGQLLQSWNASRDAYIAQNPDTQWNEQAPTPLNLEIASILDAKGNEFLHYLPHGFSIAAQVAKWKLGDAERSALSEKLHAAEVEVARLNSKLGLKPAPSSPAPSAKGPNDMSREDFGHWLQEQARIADAA